VSRLVLAFRHVDHVEHVRGKPESVPELLDEDGEVDQDEVVRKRIRQVDVDGVRDVDRDDHRPEPESEAVARGEDSADDSAGRQRENADRSVDEADLTGSERESTRFLRIEEERRCQLDELCLAETIEQQEQEDDGDALLPEEERERSEELGEDALPCFADRRAVCRGTWQDEPVIQEEEDEHARQEHERDRPCQGDVAGAAAERGLRREVEPVVELDDGHRGHVPVLGSEDVAFALGQRNGDVSGLAAEVHHHLVAGFGAPER
jgi:hypothetical protein